jgi:hypothetical protein
MGAAVFPGIGALDASGHAPPRGDPDGRRGSLAITCDDDVYTAVIRQAAHDAVRALLTAPPDSIAGSQALHEVTTWLAAEQALPR